MMPATFLGSQIIALVRFLSVPRSQISIMGMLRFDIQRSRPGCERLPVALYVRKDNRAAKLVKLIATCGPLDLNDPRTAITVMMSDED